MQKHNEVKHTHQAYMDALHDPNEIKCPRIMKKGRWPKRKPDFCSPSCKGWVDHIEKEGPSCL